MEKHRSCCAGSRKDIGHNEKINDRGQYFTKPSEMMFQNKMVHIPRGAFLMGTNMKEGFSADGEGPIRKIKVDSFLIDATTVTNAEFKSFIDDTGYVTESEAFGWSFVFDQFLSKQTLKKAQQRVQAAPWWVVVEGATWDHPEGPDSDIKDRMNHPVIHISWNDAQAFCEWVGKRLPTEAEWEYAARGGLEQKTFPWGNELTPNGEHYCNIWQGKFPTHNEETDGFAGTAPVESFPANGFGLYNVSGNVWEWCSDWFASNIHKRGGKDNPTGPETGDARVMRGGSYLCHKSYCNRYRVAARSSNTADSSTGNIGFRCAVSV